MPHSFIYHFANWALQCSCNSIITVLKWTFPQVVEPYIQCVHFPFKCSPHMQLDILLPQVGAARTSLTALQFPRRDVNLQQSDYKSLPPLNTDTPVTVSDLVPDQFPTLEALQVWAGNWMWFTLVCVCICLTETIVGYLTDKGIREGVGWRAFSWGPQISTQRVFDHVPIKGWRIYRIISQAKLYTQASYKDLWTLSSCTHTRGCEHLESFIEDGQEPS